MNNTLLSRCAESPATFRQSLLIDASGKIIPFKPDPWQEMDFTAMDAAWLHAVGRWQGEPPLVRRSWQERPRGHSKSSDLAIMLAWALFSAQRPIKAIGAAGDRDQAGLLRDALETLCRCNPWLGDLLDVQSWRVVNRRTGSQLEIISSDVATSWGQLVDVIACDEVSHWPSDGLWVSLLSTAAKRSNTVLACILNAGFTESWAWQTREAVRQDPAWHFSHLDGPQASWLSGETLDEQRRLLPALAFDRLWGNAWAAGSGDALQESDLQAALVEAGPMDGSEPGYSFFGGLDLSVSRDTSALVMLARHNKTRVIRLAAIRAWTPSKGSKVDLNDVLEVLVRLSGQYQRPLVVFDVFQAELLRQQAAKRGVRMQEIAFSGKPTQEMASELIESFSSRRIRLYSDPHLLGDLRRLRIVERPSGWRLDAPRTQGNHCDRGVAMSMALWGARTTEPMRHFNIGFVGEYKEPQPPANNVWPAIVTGPISKGLWD